MAFIPAFEQKKVISLFIVLAYVALALLGLCLLYALRDVIPPFLVATIIAMTLRPEIDRLERQGLFGRRFKRGIAIGIVYVLFLGIFALMVKGLTLVSGQMIALIFKFVPKQLLSASPSHGTQQQTAELARQQAELARQQAAELADHWMHSHHVPQILQSPIHDQARHIPDLLGQGMTWFGDSLPALAENLVFVVIVPIIAFFILLDFNKILGKTLLLFPRDKREGILMVVTDIIAVFGSYVRGVVTVMALDICVIFAVLWFAGLHEYALTLAITAGLLYTIPYFGALVSTILIGLVTLATHGLITAVVVTLIMIFIHQIVFDNIVAPRVIGGSVNLHPLLTLLALMIGGTLFKIGGTLLAVPIAAAFQVILIHLFPQFKTDVVAVHRAANVVQKTIAKAIEEEKPALRKEDNAPQLQQEEDATRSVTQIQPALLPPADAAKS